MGNYIALADIERRISPADLVRLADHDEDGTADAAVVSQAIEDAEGEIDSYLGKVYVVPIPAPVPKVLQQKAVTMACYFLYKGRRALSEDIKDNYKACIAWLKDIVAGKAGLGILPKPSESAGAGGVRHSVKDRVFGRDEPL